MKLNILIMGAPGAGKGTQSELINKEYNIPHISTGDIFRENIKGNTDLGKLALNYINKGHLVPDDVTKKLVEDRFSRDDVKGGFLLDGYPRTAVQVKDLKEVLDANGLAVNLVINIDTPEELLVKRLTGRRICKDCKKTYHVMFNPPKVEGICDACGGELYQRDDDNVESAKVRLETYAKDTKPLIDHYTSENLLVNVNGDASMDEVFNNVQKAIKG